MTTLYAKLENGVLVTTCAPEEDADLIAQLLSDGFKPYDESASQPQAEEFQAAVPVYRDTGERIVLEWTVEENSPEKVEAEIERLKAELTATDYQVIKSYEYALAGVPAAYDIEALHTSHEQQRIRIRELETLLSPEEPVDPVPTPPWHSGGTVDCKAAILFDCGFALNCLSELIR